MDTFILRNKWALGDTVCLSALVRDLALTFHGRYKVLVTGHFGAFWKHNPHTQFVAPGDGKGTLLNLSYVEGIKAAGRGEKVHFLSWFHRDFKAKTGVGVPVLFPRGDIHLTDAEKKNPRFCPHRYWVINCGWKSDMPTKAWHPRNYQQVVDTLLHYGVRCVQAGADFHKQYHPRLTNCDCAVGHTDDIRKLFALIYHADGVVCGITAMMHIAAALEKPCVVLGGGREEPWWESYSNHYPGQFGPDCQPVAVPHRYLHTVGLLECCQTKGCWRDKIMPGPKSEMSNAQKPHTLCKLPVARDHYHVPHCMEIITPAHVVEAVMEYYESGHLPPVGQPAGDYPTPSGDNAVGAAVPELPRFVSASQLPTPAPPPVVGEKKTFSGSGVAGDKFTAFVLGYGDHLKLVKRCLESILRTTAPGVLDVRVALNQPSSEMEDYVNALAASGRVTLVYKDQAERRKYPAMREMFHDEKHPITTRYVLWFDDDSHVIDKGWLDLLSQAIVTNHHQGCRLYGTKFVHDLMPYRRQGFAPEKWFEQATWWKGRNLWSGGGSREVSNGSQIVFCTGGFWALCTEVLKECDVPDARMQHNGGDIVVGEQVHQGGYKVKDFSRGKRPVCWSDAPRRGFSQAFPWSKFRG